MAKRSLKDLKAQLENNKTDGYNNNDGFFYPFWKLPFDGQVRIRILEDPDQDNPLIIYREYLEHSLFIGGKKVYIPCPKNNGKNTPCPLCEISAKLYKADNKVRGKFFYREAYWLIRAIVISDGLEYKEGMETAQGKCRPFKLSFQLGKKLLAEMGKLDEDETFWDLDDGLDFIIEKSKNQVDDKEYGKYDLASGFVRKNTSIPEEYRENITDEPLSALVPSIPSYDEVQELLDKYIRESSGQSADDDDEDVQDATESESDLMEKLNRNKAAVDKKPVTPKVEEKKATKTTKVVEDNDPPFDLDEDVDVFDTDSDDDDSDDILSLLDDND